MWNEWLIVLLSNSLGIGSYFIAKLFCPKDKSPFGFHNYFCTIFSFICILFTTLGIFFFSTAMLKFFIFILTL